MAPIGLLHTMRVKKSQEQRKMDSFGASISRGIIKKTEHSINCVGIIEILENMDHSNDFVGINV